MKKILTIIAVIASITVTASTRQLKIINNTPYYLDYMMTTTPTSAIIPTYGFPLYRQSNLVTQGPYSNVLYNDPSNTGLPFYLLPGTWDYYPANWSSFSVVTGAAAFARNGNNQMWASIKFNIYKPGSPTFSLISGHIGPFQGPMYSASGNGVTITWITSGTNVTIVVS